MKNSIVAATSLGMLVLACSACFDESNEADAANAAAVSSVAEKKVADSANLAAIKLSGKSISVTGKGATVQGNRVTITAAGTYRISGTLEDGQVIVDIPDGHDAQRVRLQLAGASIHSNSGAPLEVRRAEQVEIELVQGSVNQLSDAARAAGAEVNAALYSKEDLTLSGKGTLQVRGNYRHGIVSRDSLKVADGVINVQALGDGLKGRDAIRVQGGALTVVAEGDGLQSDGVETGQGVVRIEGGVVKITTGGGSAKGTRSNARRWGPPQPEPQATTQENSQQASKGIKAGQQLIVNGGSLDIDARENALSANDTVTIAGGVLRLKSGNAGVHADKQLSITGGDLQIAQSFEGLESAAISISNGRIHLQAADDGINLVSNQGGFLGGPRGGNGGDNVIFTMSGGYVYVDAGSDGADADAAGELTGGTLLINGPAASMNGALDFDGGLKVKGGLLLAVGTAGMAQAPPETSTQNAVSIVLPSNLEGGTPVQIATESGKPVLSFVPTKAYQSLVWSSPELKSGQTYVVYTGGKFSGSAVDGLYAGSGLSAGTEAARFTVAGAVTYVGSGGFGGGRGGMGRW